MAHGLKLPSIISTNVRFMSAIVAHGVPLRASAALAPGLAGAWAERLFLTPPKPQATGATQLDLLEAWASFAQFRGRQIATWSWGSRDAPAVLLAHGWGGRAAQLRALAMRLAAEGHRVIAYDQPAHGLSGGRLTGLPDFAGALAAVARYHGGVHAVVAHSLGAAGAAIAMAHGLPVERAVLISPPSDLVGYSRRFARWHWMPERLRGAMQAAIEERFGVRWEELEIARLAPRLGAAALVIHDRGDRVVPWRLGAAFARAWPGARLLSTRGLGHGRLLEHPSVLDAAADFIAGRSQIAGPARPEIAHPAPIY